MSATSRRNKRLGRKTTEAVRVTSVASCPLCGGPGQPHDVTALICQNCGGIFDNTPDEGGTHHDTDASRRLTRQEEQQARQRERLARRHPSRMTPR